MTATDTSPSNGKTPKTPERAPEYVGFRLQRADLHVNDADNARSSLQGHDGKAAYAALMGGGKAAESFEKDFGSVDKGLARLALAIATDGLENPPIVRPTTDADKEARKLNKPFVLVMGFRRVRAVDILGWDHFDARKPAGDRDRKQTFLAALAENFARDNLSPYEGAMASDRAIKEYAATETEVAAATGISRSHVGNQVRLVRRLPASALLAWKDASNPAHNLCAFNNLTKIAAMETDIDRDAAWDQLCRGSNVTANGTTPGTDPNAPTPDASGKKPPSARKIMERIRSTFNFINSAAGKSFVPPPGNEWFRAFSRYLAGYGEKAPEGLSVLNPEPKAKKVRAKKRDDAKKGTKGGRKGKKEASK